jgi:hypothetical protein
MRIIETRLDAVEAVSAASPAVQSVLDAVPPAEVDDVAIAAVCAVASGRVLVADAAPLLRTLVDRGVSAYGTEPRRALHTALVRDGIDVRPDTALHHLRSLLDGSIDTVVLVDVVDVAALAVQIELVQQACRVARAVVVVVPTTPTGIRAELAAGRPLSTGAWRHLIEREGWTVSSEQPVVVAHTS